MPVMKHTVLSVEGMTCSSCVRHVEGALRKLEGVGTVTVSLADGEARIEHDPSLLPVARMVAVVGEAGYDARPSRR